MTAEIYETADHLVLGVILNTLDDCYMFNVHTKYVNPKGPSIDLAFFNSPNFKEFTSNGSAIRNLSNDAVGNYYRTLISNAVRDASSVSFIK
jgi:hypothetical protein